MNEKPVLRELSVGELLDKAFRLYRAQFLPLLGITAAVLIPFTLLQILSAVTMGSTQIVDLIQAFFNPLILGALAIATSRTYLSATFTIRQAFSLGSKRYGSILGAGILQGLALVAPALIFLVFTLLGSFFQVIGFLGYLAVLLYLTTRWAIGTVAIVLENIGASEGLSRSWKLTDKHFWRVLGTSTAASAIVILATLLPIASLNILTDWLSIPEIPALLVSTVISQLIVALVNPFSVAVNVLIYYDLRIRVEAFDLEYAIESPETPAASGS
ncbi:MAG: hypothetical protein ACOY0R_01550 [Chloroflexota bacterium]